MHLKVDVNLCLSAQSTSEEVASSTVVGRAGAGAAGGGAGAYDVTRMREEEFERLTVYIVPDVPCEPGTAGRAERTLPRSLALRPSAVLSTPNTPVRTTSFFTSYDSSTQEQT